LQICLAWSWVPLGGSVKTSNDKWLVVTSSNRYYYQFWLFWSEKFITGGIWFGHDENSTVPILSIPPGYDDIAWWTGGVNSLLCMSGRNHDSVPTI
jgi:hypothetical protein